MNTESSAGETLAAGTRLGRRDAAALIFISLLVLGFMWRVVFLGHVLLPLDEVFQMEPWKSESPPSAGPVWNPVITDAVWQVYPMGSVAKQLRQSGHYFWDPYPMGGMPALARGDVFTHPWVVLFSHFTSVGRAMSWAAVVALLIGGCFTYLLLRELGCGVMAGLIGSVTFTFNGYLVGWLCIPNMTGSMVWLPAIAWAIERAIRRRDWRWSLAGAAAFALQICAGSLLWSLYAAITMAVLLTCRAVLQAFQLRAPRAALRPLCYGAIAFAVGAGLAAIPLVLNLQLYSQSDRTFQAGAKAFLKVAVHTLRFIAPNVYGSSIHGEGYRSAFNFAETNLYFGIFPLFFVVAGLLDRRRALTWPMFGLGLAALVAVYNVQPVRQLVAWIYPVFLNTFPGRIFYVIVFCWSVVAGLGADWLLRHNPRRVLWAFALIAFLLAGAALGLIAAVTHMNSDPAAHFGGEFLQQFSLISVNSLYAGAGFLLATSVTFLLWGFLRRASLLVCGMVLAIMIADLFAVGVDYNPALSEAIALPETASVARLRALQGEEGGASRLALVPSYRILYGMAPEMYGLETVSGYTSYALTRYARYIHLTQPVTTINHIFLTGCCSPLIDALNAKYVFTPEGMQLENAQNLTRIYDGTVDIYENRAALPRAWVVHRTSTATPGDLDAVQAKLLAPGFSPATEAVVEADRALAGDAGGQTSSARITRYEPERVLVETDLTQPGLLVMSDTMYPGWSAQVDGRRQPIYYTNLFMRGVFLEPGAHQVEFRYTPDVLPIGATISIVTIALVLGAVAIDRARRARRSPP